MADLVRDRVLAAEQATALVGSKVPDIDPDITGRTVLIDADSGKIVLAYLPLDRVLVRQLRRQIVGYRCAAVQRNANYETRSTTFGYSPRAAINGRDDCRASVFARDEPDRQRILTATANELRKMLADIDQSIVDDDLESLAPIENDWFLGESELWTSGVINQSSELPYHRDSFNFPTWSAMPVLRRGMDGGRLSVPEYGATIACRDGWVVFFPGHDLVHGVTPMRAQADDSYRYSIVYYALRGMKDCHTAAVETAWARERRTAREREMAQRIKERNANA